MSNETLTDLPLFLFAARVNRARFLARRRRYEMIRAAAERRRMAS